MTQSRQQASDDTSPQPTFFTKLTPEPLHLIPAHIKEFNLTEELSQEEATFIDAFLNDKLSKANQNSADAQYVLAAGYYSFAGQDFYLHNNLVAHMTRNSKKHNKADLPDSFSKFDVVDSYIGAGAYGEIYGCSGTLKKSKTHGGHFTVTPKLFGKKRIVKTIHSAEELPLYGSYIDNNFKVHDGLKRKIAEHEADINLSVPELHATKAVKFEKANPDNSGKSITYHFLISRQVEGQDIEKALDGDVFTYAERLLASRNVLRATKVAHRAGLVHRDVKPGNFIIDVDDNFKVTLVDYGLAKRIEWDTTGIRGIGTAQYCSPEMINGQNTVYEDDSIGAMRVIAMIISNDPTLMDTLYPSEDANNPANSMQVRARSLMWLSDGKMFPIEKLLGPTSKDPIWNQTRAEIYDLFLKNNQPAAKRIKFDDFINEWDAIIQRYDERLVAAGLPKQVEPLIEESEADNNDNVSAAAEPASTSPSYRR